nr:hypothetical protein [Tanacetum cinerariifolium]
MLEWTLKELNHLSEDLMTEKGYDEWKWSPMFEQLLFLELVLNYALLGQRSIRTVTDKWWQNGRVEKMVKWDWSKLEILYSWNGSNVLWIACLGERSTLLYLEELESGKEEAESKLDGAVQKTQTSLTLGGHLCGYVYAPTGLLMALYARMGYTTPSLKNKNRNQLHKPKECQSSSPFICKNLSNME